MTAILLDDDFLGDAVGKRFALGVAAAVWEVQLPTVSNDAPVANQLLAVGAQHGTTQGIANLASAYSR